jgi:hypothetical protein
MAERRFKTEEEPAPDHPRDGSLRDAAVSLLKAYDRLGDKTTRGPHRIGQTKVIVGHALKRVARRQELLERDDRTLDDAAEAVRSALEEIEETEEEWS